jgi:EpsI family protein
MSRDLRRFAVAIALLALTAVLLYLPGHAREVPLTGSLYSIPLHLGGWTASNDPPPDLPSLDPAAREQATLAFRHGNEVVWVSVFYYPLNSEERRGRGRDLVLPRRGWSDLAERSLEIPLGPGVQPLSADLVSIRVHGQPLTILYWYQVRGHSLASAHGYRLALLYNRLFHHRADGALVRIIWPAAKSFDDGSAGEAHVAFVRALHQELLRVLPR